MIYDVIVVGGGAAGLMASIVAKENGKSVLLLERMDKLGKKLLATGNGRCNLTNDVMNETSYRGELPSFADVVLKNFSQGDLLDFFQSLGMLTTQLNGYYYPASFQASTVVDTLVEKIHSLGVKVQLECEVSSVKRTAKGYEVISKNKDRFQSKQLILSTGGKAQEKLGSNGSGYTLAKQLGHHITDVFPGLVALESPEKYFKDIQGVRSGCAIQLFVNDSLDVEERGEVQFTKYGVSGIPIFQLSRYAIYALRNKKKVHLNLNLMPDMLTLEDTLEQLKKQCSYKNAQQFFSGFLNHKLAACVLKRCQVNPKTRIIEISKKQWGDCLRMIQSFPVAISGYKGFDMAQISVGGVKTTEIINETLESKYQKGLFIVGELLDVDGTCGGYNLQFCFSSGYVAAMNLQ